MISLELGLSDCIHAVSVSFGKAPVRCSSPCFQQDQSISTVLWECTAASPEIADHPGHPQPPGTSMCLTKPLWLCPLWLPTPGSPTHLLMAECWAKQGCTFCCTSSSSGTRVAWGCQHLQEDLLALPLSTVSRCQCCLPWSAAGSCCAVPS